MVVVWTNREKTQVERQLLLVQNMESVASPLLLLQNLHLSETWETTNRLIQIQGRSSALVQSVPGSDLENMEIAMSL